MLKWRRSFRYAYEGVKYALSTQRNMKFHFFAAFIVMLLALYLRLPKLEILFILLAVTLMIVTELINTAIEKTVDLAMPDHHPLAKIAKDVAAASVLVSAVFAAVVGMVVFYEPVDQLFRNVRTSGGMAFSAATLWILISLVALATIVLDTRFSSKDSRYRLSLLSAIAFAIATCIAFYSSITYVVLLAYFLAFLVMLVLYDKRSRSLASLILGGLVGTCITFAIYYVIN
ncbi:diacylglycerol kinase [Paenibacillus agricola]|nr:diacylglycerol kinase [Paenibacillus agricola]